MLVWKEIPDFPKYEASPDGFIRNKKTQHILSPINKGYEGKPRISVSLRKEGSTGYFDRTIGSLILQTFVSFRPRAGVVGYKNGDCTDNRLVNLEWVSMMNPDGTRRSYNAVPPDDKYIHSTYTTLTYKNRRVAAHHHGLSNLSVRRLLRGEYVDGVDYILTEVDPETWPLNKVVWSNRYIRHPDGTIENW